MEAVENNVGAVDVPAEKSSIKKVVGAAMAGTIAEWYEFFIYGIASTLVFSKLFFPAMGDGSLLMGIIAAFATYAVGFIARPLGGLVFGHYGDIYGRKKLLQISLIMVGVATFLMGCIPSYESIGYAAPAILVLLRFIQGFAVGGEWGGAMLLVGEHSPENQRGFWTSFPQAAACAGNVLASLVLLGLSFSLVPEDFLSWGWRIAFWLSAIIVFIGYYIRKNVEESDVFKEQIKRQEENQKAAAGLKEVLVQYPKQALFGMLMRVGENSTYYIIVVFSIAYMSIQLKFEYTTILLLLLCANAFQFFAMIFSGYLSDKIGRKLTMYIGYAGLVVWLPFYFVGLDTAQFYIVLLSMCVGLYFQAMCYAGQGAVLAEIFPTRMRYSGSSFCYQISAILAGSIAPMIATMLWKTYDSTTPITIYIMSVIALSVFAIFMLKETRGRSLHEVDHEDQKKFS
ncbi:MFS transporter [Acinetobacter towneri]|uniref:MFS transporter n=2 Tax=Acinetobacter TaxID=469 RepID=A0AAP9KIQ2_9GAMM|nr:MULTISPECIES: MFS transporter [Acinetobacter]MEB5928610.1 MHS family MFS transporter [Acinetobacter schindleri]PJI33127.1 MFS transporter [Acinetobacter pseudolwoffii]QGM27299.1 MFS transporter [Acinetobacter towneri]